MEVFLSVTGLSPEVLCCNAHYIKLITYGGGEDSHQHKAVADSTASLDFLSCLFFPTR